MPEGSGFSGAPTLRIVVWNLQWRRPGGRQEELLKGLDPDLAILTETAGHEYLDGGHWIESEADYGYPAPEYRRKVRLWSRWPWSEVDRHGHPNLPGGRFAAGTTRTPLGALRVLGLCIPWRDAHVRTGRKDREAWEDHLRYLDRLGPLLESAPRPLVVGGDWNQRIPRKWQPKRVFEALGDALPGDLEVVTAGEVPRLDRLLIDHLALSSELVASGVEGFEKEDEEGGLSDHDGVVVEVGRRR